MHTHKLACALAIQIQIADVKLIARPVQFLFIRTVDCACQSKLSIVRDFQSIVIIVCFYNREHRTEYFFLFDRGSRLYVGNYRRLDEVALLAVWASTPQHAAGFTLSLLQ